MSQGFDLSIEANLDSLQEVRQFINRAGETLGVNGDTLGDLRLAVDEAVTNVILHGYKSRGGPLDIRMESDGDDVVISIRDQAEPFDPSKAHDPQLDTSLSERPFGGMGLYLIRKMSDEAEFRALPGRGNELRLVKRGAITS